MANKGALNSKSMASREQAMRAPKPLPGKGKKGGLVIMIGITKPKAAGKKK